MKGVTSFLKLDIPSPYSDAICDSYSEKVEKIWISCVNFRLQAPFVYRLVALAGFGLRTL